MKRERNQCCRLTVKWIRKLLCQDVLLYTFFHHPEDSTGDATSNLQSKSKNQWEVTDCQGELTRVYISLPDGYKMAEL